MTPANYSIPSRWTLVTKQDFESSTLSSTENKSGTISTAKPHTGSNSLGGLYNRDQSDVSWWLRADKIGSFSEIYLSFYEYTESQARFNDEYWLAQFAKRGPSDELYQEIIIDWMWVPNFNDTKAYLYIVPQRAAGGVGRRARYGGALQTVPTGSWTQWEIHYRPNTSGSSNGFLRIYKNGSLWSGNSAENKNLNGAVNMSNMSIQVGGGIYTKLAWMKDYPTCSAPSGCSTYFGNGVDLCMSQMDWWGQSFSAPVCPNTAQSNFNRYFDDIILMKK